MQKLNTRILIIVAGIILVLLIAVTIFVSGLTKNNQTFQQFPTLIPTGIFESTDSRSSRSSGGSNSISGNLTEAPPVSETNEKTDRYKLITDDEANKLEDLKNKTPLDTADFTIGYSSKLGEYFVSTENSQGEEKFKQYLSTNGLSNVYSNFPELFHISSQPLDQAISQAEQTYQNEEVASDQQLQNQMAKLQNQSNKTGTSSNNQTSQQTPTEIQQQALFFDFIKSLVTFNYDTNTTDNGSITNGGGGGGNGGSGTIGGPISATAQELLNNPKLTLNQGCARPDLENGIVDERLITVLATILQTHTLYIGSFKTCHSKYIAGTNIISNHYYGRAADIMSVDGKGVSSSNQGALEVVKWLFALSPPLKPGEIGQPWFAGPPPYFTNADHLYHIHVGYYAP